MLLRRHGDFSGGIDLPDEKRETLDQPIRLCHLPDRLHVPLGYGHHRPASPVVREGQRVPAGHLLAVGEGSGLDIFAPVGGVVCSLADSADVAGPGGFVTVPAIELTDLEAAPSLPRSDDDHTLALQPEELRSRLADGQIPVFRRPVGSLAAWVDRAHRTNCQLLVANIMEDQPYVTAAHRTLAENGRDVVLGLALLGRAIEVDQMVLAVDHRRTDAYRHVEPVAERYGIQLVSLPHKYPSGADVILLKILTGVEAPPEGGPLDVGAGLIDASTCLAVCRWLRHGRRTTARVVTIAGQQIVTANNYLVPFGMRCSELAGLASRSLVHGGAMTGLFCTHQAVVTPATDAVLGLGVTELLSPRPCIRCGWCTDHCPARLNVAALNDAFELVDLVSARRHGAEACVGCGVCGYVCPARLPLAERVKALRRAALQAAASRVGMSLTQRPTPLAAEGGAKP